jgi:ubiquitin-protein ligase
MAAKVPRNFRLLEELEKGEKGLGAGRLSYCHEAPNELTKERLEACSYGLTDGDDLMMSNWNGTILGPPHVSAHQPETVHLNHGLCKADRCWVQSAHENRIYSLNIHCGESYPDIPPTVQFVSKINLPCVDQRTGKVKCSARCQWVGC